MKIKRAERIGTYMCPNCASVHIGMWRNGKIIAEAIPVDIEAFAADLARTIAESKRAGQRGPLQ